MNRRDAAKVLQQVGEILHALCSEEWMDPNDVMILAGASSEIARVEEVLQKDAGR